MQPLPDPYRALGVPRGASEAEIKAAHRKLAKRYHPDASGGDTSRFLSVQEAYRVLSDPLLRREWDARNAGPVRATQAAGAKPRPARPKRRTAQATAQASTQNAEAQAAAAQDASASPPRDGGPGRPRSSRAYTWSASEVPWWEEGTARERKRTAARRRGAASTQASGRTDAGLDFDVYNRSSGAAWSMAARKYFRRDEADLPSRGSFHHQGTQPLTAARARAAAEADARQQSARAGRTQSQASQPTQPAPAPAPPTTPPRKDASPPRPAAPAYAYANAGVAHGPESVDRVRQQFQRRVRARQWPTIRQRLLYALAAWLPLAIVIGYGGWVATGCDRGAASCPPSLELTQGVLIGLLLGIFALLPKVGYIAAMGTLGLLAAAALSVGAMILLAAPLPLSLEMLALFGAALAVGYVIGAATAVIRGGPWKVARR